MDVTLAIHPKVVDENGEPKVVYHGTNANFTTFDIEKAGSATDSGFAGKGFYFHVDKGTADAYGRKNIAVFLNLKNPYDFAGKNFAAVVDEHGGSDNFSQWLKNNGYDGSVLWGQRMVLNNTQIKSATDNVGTFDATNPDIRFSVIGEGVPDYQAQYDAVVAKYKGTAQWMKAPNGKPTNLTERQWVQVRTPAFKAWFGDWEALAELVSITDGVSISDLRKKFGNSGERFTYKGETFVNEESGVNAKMSGVSYRKMTSNTAVDKSVKNGFTARQHNEAVVNIKKLFEQSHLLVERGDKNGDPNVLAIRRFACPILVDGKMSIAWITTKESLERGNKVYSIEMVELKKLVPKLEEDSKENRLQAASIKDRISKMDSLVNGVSKVVDENGEPKVVSHSTNTSFTAFEKTQVNDAGWLGKGFYFFGDRSLDGQYGRNVMETFLNVRNPYFLSEEEHNDLADMNDNDASSRFSDEIREEDYDGVFYNGDMNQEWVAFAPTQIKSATDNVGIFDATNPDIRYSVVRDQITTKESVANGNRIYSLEMMELKTLTPNLEEVSQGNRLQAASVKNKISNILSEVNRESDAIRYAVVYHGSHADFMQFDHSHMGEGEGAQAYGWGTYLTQVEGIAREYADQKNEGRHLYTVDIPDDNGKNYLHWENKLLPEQAKTVADVLLEMGWRFRNDEESEAYNNGFDSFVKEYGYPFLVKEGEIVDLEMPFENAYSHIKNASSIKDFSLGLADKGLVGISYPAQHRSGGRDDDARNFVIFKESDAQIQEHTRFSVSTTLKDDIEKAFAHKIKAKTLIPLCSEPEFFSALGLPHGDIVTRSYAIRKLRDDHGLDVDPIMANVKALGDPVFVLKDGKDAVIIITGIMGKNKKGEMADIMAAIHLEKEKTGDHYLASLYPLDDLDKIKNKLRAKALIYSKYKKDALTITTADASGITPALVRAVAEEGDWDNVITKDDLRQWGVARFDELNSSDENKGVRYAVVYHGSHADFMQFDHSHMGEGEGAQSYGWGTYLTQVEGIAREYADQKNEGRHLYTVDIPDENGKNYLHWEKPIGAELRKQLNTDFNGFYKYAKPEVAEEVRTSAWTDLIGIGVPDENDSGENLYRYYKDVFGSQQKASEYLSEKGLVGISYPAEHQSGGRDDDARNFVIFKESDAQIQDHTRFSVVIDNQTFHIREAREILNRPAQDVIIHESLGKNDIKKVFASFGEVTNEANGRVVKFPGGSAGKIHYHKGFDTGSVIRNFDALYRRSRLVVTEPPNGHKDHSNLEKYEHYLNKFSDGLNEYFIRFTVPIVHRGTGASYLHSSAISEVDIYKTNGAPSLDTASNRGQLGTPFVDNKISNLFDVVNGVGSDESRASIVFSESAKPKQQPQRLYPSLLNTLSDDELITAAVASKMALGTSEKLRDQTVSVNAVQRMLKRVHPDWDTNKIGLESKRVLQGAREFSKRIKADLDRGVSDSLILEHLPEAARETFGTEMREEARKGQKLGAFATRVKNELKERQAKMVEDAVRVQTGIDAGNIENTYGINLSETIMQLAANPLKEKPQEKPEATDDKPGEATDASDGANAITGKEVDAKVKEVVEDLIRASGKDAARDDRNRKNRQEHAAREDERRVSEAGGESDAPEGETAGEALARAVRKHGLDLETPRHLARFITEMARRKWIKDHELALDAEVWQDLVAVQFLRKTAQSVYTKLVNDLTYSRSRETAMAHIVKLDAAPTVNGLLREMEFVGALVNAQRIRETQQSLCEKLDLLLKEKFGAQGRFKPDKEEGKRKVTAEAELRARYMRHAMWLTPEAKAKEAGELTQRLDTLAMDFEEAGRDVNQSREFNETIRKLAILSGFGALRYKPVAEIEDAIQRWEDAAKGSNDAILQEMSDREIRTTKAAHLLAVAFTNPKTKTVRETNTVADLMNKYLQGHMGFMSLLQDMTRYASDADRDAVKNILGWLSREIQKAGDRTATEKRRQNDAFYKAVTTIYGTKNFNAVMKQLNKTDERFLAFMGEVGGKKDIPTKARAMQLLVSLLQEGRRVEVEDPENPGQKKTEWMGGYHDNIVRHKREGQAAQLMELMTPQDLQMIQWLGDWYEQNRADLSTVCHALFGIGVQAELPNYFPVKMRLEKQGLEKGEAVGYSLFPKALTPRVKNEKDFDTSADIFQMWASRMEEGAQWKSHAQLGLELRGIFGRAELQSAVIANHGTNANALMQSFITDILAGHGAVDRSPSGTTVFSDKMRGWTALCALGGNVGVMLKQTTSIPAFGFEIGLVNTAKHIVTAFTPEGMAAMGKIWNSEQRKTRWDVGSSELVQNALNKKNSGLLKRLFQASMITNKLGDAVPALVVGQGIYRDFLEQGMSEEDAMAETWSIVERTQQSGRMENQINVQRRNKLGRTFYQFLSTNQQMLQYETRAIREVIANPTSVKRWGNLGSVMLLNHFILTSMYFWMGELYKACLGQEPPEDQLKDWVISCLLGSWGSLMVAGFCCKATLDRAIKGYSYGGGSSMLPMEGWMKTQINDGAKLIEAIFWAEGSTWDEMIEAVTKWMNDFNSTFRDLRKIYRFRVKDEPQ